LGCGLWIAGFAASAQDPPSADKVRAALRVADFENARRDAEALAALSPGDAGTLALLGDARWAAGLFDEADAAYERALARDPESSRARFGQARSLASRSRLTDALSHTLAILGSAGADPDVHALAATVRERLGRFDDAAASYEAHAGLLPPGEETAIASARARAGFLRSFTGRTPFALRDQDSSAVHTIPFKLVRNKVIVQGRLNGESVEWVIDTGAERTSISWRLASLARVRAVTTTLTAGVGPAALRRVQLARADTVELGSLRIRDVPVSVRPPSNVRALRWNGESLSPLALGLSMVVDYRRRQIILARELPVEDAEVTLGLRMQRLPLVRGTLNAKHPAPFVVDTGGEVISISGETADALGMQPTRRIPLRVFGLSGLDETAFLLPGVRLEFDQIEYQRIGLAVLNLRAPSVLLGFQLGGIVGHKFLSEYRVAFDVARSELKLTRANEARRAGEARGVVE
jgi:predicted aspartyl protease